jgi:hypothetical protein
VSEIAGTKYLRAMRFYRGGFNEYRRRFIATAMASPRPKFTQLKRIGELEDEKRRIQEDMGSH